MLCVCFHDTTVPGVRPSLMERWLWVVGSLTCAVILVHGVHAKVRVMQVLTSWPKGSTSSPTEKVKKKGKQKVLHSIASRNRTLGPIVHCISQLVMNSWKSFG